MSEKSWIITEDICEHTILGKASTDFWKKQMMELGGDYVLWVNTPKDPNLN
jgi:putative transcriptional regulator